MKKEEKIHKQNREQLERELERIKNELRAVLAKDEMKCLNSDVEEKCQEKHDRANMSERQKCLEQIEDSRQLSAVELERPEQKQRIKDNQSIATGHENKRMQDETEEEQRKVDVRENENGTHMETDERSNEEEGTEVQTDYSNDNSNTDSMSSDDTVQQDCRCNSVILYSQLKTSCAQITTLKVPHNSDRQETPAVDQTLRHCIAQECVTDDIVQSSHAHANLLDEQLQISGIKITSIKVYHDTVLQRKDMQRTLRMYIAQECATEVPLSLIQLKILLGDSEIRNIVYAEFIYIGMTCKNSYLCFKFLWWQDGLLLS